MIKIICNVCMKKKYFWEFMYEGSCVAQESAPVCFKCDCKYEEAFKKLNPPINEKNKYIQKMRDTIKRGEKKEKSK